MQHILIIGGDSRYLEIIHALRKKKCRISLIGYEQLTFTEEEITSCTGEEIDFSTIDAIILPVHGTSPVGAVTSSYSEQTFFITKALIAETPEHCVIYTGIANDFLRQATENRKLEIIFARDDIAIYNSISTAEATLQLAIEHTPYTIHGANVSVLGFGRVGFTIARLFKNVGANVTVFVRKSADIARISELGMNGEYVDLLTKKIGVNSICINTVPHQIVDEKVIDAMQQDSLIIDVASAPGGTDFAYAEQNGIHALHALGLPGKTAPKSAGQILAQTIVSLMDEQ